jgi:hypothetical protein
MELKCFLMFQIAFFIFCIGYKIKLLLWKKILYTIFVNLDKINITMIKVSDTAKKKIIDLMQDDGFDAATDYVRVGVKAVDVRFVL